MIFQEPKVEFVELQVNAVLTESGSQSQIGQCDGYVSSTEDCTTTGGAWNY